MNHTLRPTGEVYVHRDDSTIPVYVPDGWYRYEVHEGDTVIINDGATSSMYILKGYRNCEECPISTDTGLCAIAVKCWSTGTFRSVCRAQFGVHSIDGVLENL